MGRDNSSSWCLENVKSRKVFINKRHNAIDNGGTRFFVSNAFFNSTLLFLNFLMIWASKCCLSANIEYRYHLTMELFEISSFVSVSTSGSIDLWWMWSIFHSFSLILFSFSLLLIIQSHNFIKRHKMLIVRC